MGRQLFDITVKIAETESLLSSLKETKQEYERKKLPDYMTKVGQDKIGLPEFDVDLVMEDFTHANISSDWEPERRQKAFDYLEVRGDGDLIKCVLTIAFPRYMLWLARAVQRVLEGLRFPNEASPEDDEVSVPPSEMEMTVPWNTLTAFCKEQLKKGQPLDLEVLGCTTGKIVKIKDRNKQPKKRKS